MFKMLLVRFFKLRVRLVSYFLISFALSFQIKVAPVFHHFNTHNARDFQTQLAFDILKFLIELQFSPGEFLQGMMLFHINVITVLFV